MREKLLQLLPEIGDPGVQGVQQSEKPRKPYAFDRHMTCAPLHGAGVQGAQDDSDIAIAHPAHQTENEVCSRKTNKINTGSPCTPCAPVFAQDFTEDMEERAAIVSGHSNAGELASIKEPVSYKLRYLPSNFPLPWCWYAVMEPEYRKDFSDLCPLPANEVYFSAHRTEEQAHACKSKWNAHEVNTGQQRASMNSSGQ